MTAPNSGPLTNTVGVTNQGVEILNNSVADMQKIYTTVDDAIQRLVGQGMVSLSGRSYGAAVGRWLDDFNVIKQQLTEMSGVLSGTAKGLTSNEQSTSQMPSRIVSQLGNVT